MEEVGGKGTGRGGRGRALEEVGGEGHWKRWEGKGTGRGGRGRALEEVGGEGHWKRWESAPSLVQRGNFFGYAYKGLKKGNTQHNI